MALKEVYTPASGNTTPTPQLVEYGRYVSRPTLDAVVTAPTIQVVSLRSPQYGIPLAKRVEFMRELLPNGITRYVGFFSTMPGRDGTGGVEASGSGYARIAHALWRDVIVGGFVARRANSGTIRHDPLTGSLTLAGWGVWDASTGGELLVFGLLRNSDGQSRIFSAVLGDQPGFPDGALQVGIQ